MFKVSFNPVEKTIIVTEAPVNGSVTIDVQRDLYSAAKHYWLTDETANRFQFPFNVVGGNDLGGGLRAGTYYFLRTDLGWQIKPFESSHELQLTGNLYPIVATDTLFASTDGSYTVAIRLERSQLTQALTIGATQSPSFNGLEADSFLGANVYINPQSGVAGTEFPNGTPSMPVSNVEDAVTIAQRYNLTSFVIQGSIELADQIPAFSDVKGLGPIRTNVTFDGSPNSCEFTKMVVSGRLSGLCVFEECSLRNITGFSAVVKNSFIGGTIRIADGAAFAQFFDCKTIDVDQDFDPTSSPAAIDLQDFHGPVILRGYTGPIRIINLVNGNRVSVDMYSGSVYIDPTCVSGEVKVGGVARVWNESGPGCNVVEIHVETERMKELWQRFGLDPENPMTSTRDQVTFGDIAVDITGDGVNQSTVTRRP